MKQFSVVVVLAMLSSFGAKAHDGPNAYLFKCVEDGDDDNFALAIDHGKSLQQFEQLFDGPAKVYITEKVILLDAGEEGQLSVDVETG